MNDFATFCIAEQAADGYAVKACVLAIQRYTDYRQRPSGGCPRLPPEPYKHAPSSHIHPPDGPYFTLPPERSCEVCMSEIYNCFTLYLSPGLPLFLDQSEQPLTDLCPHHLEGCLMKLPMAICSQTFI
jgi:hypothetical protein